MQSQEYEYHWAVVYECLYLEVLKSKSLKTPLFHFKFKFDKAAELLLEAQHSTNQSSITSDFINIQHTANNDSNTFEYKKYHQNFHKHYAWFNNV